MSYCPAHGIHLPCWECRKVKPPVAPPPASPEPYRDLGDRSVESTRSVSLSCDACRVTWRGCAAAFECPQCGDPKEYLPAGSEPSPLDKLFGAVPDMPLERHGGPSCTGGVCSWCNPPASPEPMPEGCGVHSCKVCPLGREFERSGPMKNKNAPTVGKPPEDWIAEPQGLRVDFGEGGWATCDWDEIRALLASQNLRVVTKADWMAAERMAEQLGQCLSGELAWSPKLRREIEAELARRGKP